MMFTWGSASETLRTLDIAYQTRRTTFAHLWWALLLLLNQLRNRACLVESRLIHILCTCSSISRMARPSSDGPFAFGVRYARLMEAGQEAGQGLLLLCCTSRYIVETVSVGMTAADAEAYPQCMLS